MDDNTVKKIDIKQIKGYISDDEVHLRERLSDYYHENRNRELIDVRKINRRYATNLYIWYWEQAKSYMNQDEFNNTTMGNILYKKKRLLKGRFDFLCGL